MRRPNAEARAKALGRKIRAALRAGEFELRSFAGYFTPSRPHRPCTGCAIGAAAYAEGMRKRRWAGRGECIETIGGAHAASALEAVLLEVGFESPGAIGPGGRRTKIDRRNPFYRLGVSLRRYRDKEAAK